jgi:hypothetical protein
MKGITQKVGKRNLKGLSKEVFLQAQKISIIKNRKEDNKNKNKDLNQNLMVK